MGAKALEVICIDKDKQTALCMLPSGRQTENQFRWIDRNTMIKIVKKLGYKFVAGRSPLSFTQYELVAIAKRICEGNHTPSETSPGGVRHTPTPATTVPTGGAVAGIGDAIETLLADALRKAGGTTTGVSLEDVAILVDRSLEAVREDYKTRFASSGEALQNAMVSLSAAIVDSKPKIVHVTVPPKPTKVVTGAAHEKFPTVLKALMAGENVWMTGMAGVGKTHIGMQCAESLGVPFEGESFCGQSSKADMKGFKTASGVYESVAFRNMFENGGVYLLDEVDGANPNILLVLNSALSNGYIGFPDKKVKRHENFYALAAANTWGNGATSTYVGRQVIDESTLDRFSMVHIQLDEKLESDITHMTGLESSKCLNWLRIVRAVRKNVESNGLKVSVSPRASVSGARLLHAGFSVADTIKMRLTKGVSDEIRNKMMYNVDETI